MLKLTELSVRRGSRTTLHPLSADFPAGSVTVLLGPNGAGKSSLLQVLAGLLEGSGSAQWQDTDLLTCDYRQRSACLAWQGDLPPAEFGLTVLQRLHLASSDVHDTARLASAAQTMDVTHLLSRDLGALSSGERQRVELVALMLRDVPLWLLDEPTAHLDLRHQVACLRMLRQEVAAGRTVLVVLHDVQQAMAVADQVILLNDDGHAEAGLADGLLTAERLSSLFQVKLYAKGEGRSMVLLPDYNV